MRDFFDEFANIEKEFARLRKRMDELWKRPFTETFNRKGLELREPFMQTRETANELTFKFELPGVEKKDINLEVTPNTLRIKAQKKEAKEIVRKGFYKSEKKTAGFFRALSLPAEVEPESVETDYKNGVLTVKLKKRKARKEKVKRIKVK
ncbi:hypothetical protein B6U80_00225 [Candidatus Pacearchaeota archaeon ex4484_26]|nr:MAG: hypothetical protein B6U80_00225 [Candidatus Pacearchaeota archaeon ex4484_26]